MKDMVDLLNALPKPVTMACILDVLPRPLMVNATSSTISVQPAAGPKNPRVFILIDRLVLAIVPGGEDHRLLEMSELVSDSESIKGEILLPVEAPLAPTAPLERIARLDGRPGTSCGGCHQGERSSDAYGGKAYLSRALKQRPGTQVSLDTLRSLKDACGNFNDVRCDNLRALFGGDDATVKEQLFPAGMPTIF